MHDDPLPRSLVPGSLLLGDERGDRPSRSAALPPPPRVRSRRSGLWSRPESGRLVRECPKGDDAAVCAFGSDEWDLSGGGVMKLGVSRM